MAITNTQMIDLIPSGAEKRMAPLVNARIAQTFPLLTAGIATTNVGTNALMAGGGRKQSVAYTNPLAPDEPNIAGEDITVPGNVGKMGGAEFDVLRHDVNYAWGVADLTTMRSGFNAEGGITAGIGAYWSNQLERYTYSSWIGASKATSLAGLTYGDGTALLSYDLVNNGLLTAGMHATSFSTALVSPAQYAFFQRDKVNGGFAQKGTIDPNFDVWNGFKLIRTTAFGDGMIVVVRPGASLFEQGNCPNTTPYEVERVANGGNGQGGDILHSRLSFVSQLNGVHFKGAAATSVKTALETGTNWSAAIPVDEIGIRFIKCKLA